MTEIKSGTRVRCTLGESVVVGTVQIANRISSAVVLDGAQNANTLYTPPWQVEVIPPEIPDDIGTLVMSYGSVYQRWESGWAHITAPAWNSPIFYTLDQLRHDVGPMIHIVIVKP